ncbi:hypothetical protein M404DRAFT_1003648, partial [Pisolithus tinctorius Marx 270]
MSYVTSTGIILLEGAAFPCLLSSQCLRRTLRNSAPRQRSQVYPSTAYQSRDLTSANPASIPKYQYELTGNAHSPNSIFMIWRMDQLARPQGTYAKRLFSDFVIHDPRTGLTESQVVSERLRTNLAGSSPRNCPPLSQEEARRHYMDIPRTRR